MWNLKEAIAKALGQSSSSAENRYKSDENIGREKVTRSESSGQEQSNVQTVVLAIISWLSDNKKDKVQAKQEPKSDTESKDIQKSAPKDILLEQREEKFMGTPEAKSFVDELLAYALLPQCSAALIRLAKPMLCFAGLPRYCGTPEGQARYLPVLNKRLRALRGDIQAALGDPPKELSREELEKARESVKEWLLSVARDWEAKEVTEAGADKGSFADRLKQLAEGTFVGRNSARYKCYRGVYEALSGLANELPEAQPELDPSAWLDYGQRVCRAFALRAEELNTEELSAEELSGEETGAEETGAEETSGEEPSTEEPSAEESSAEVPSAEEGLLLLFYEDEEVKQNGLDVYFNRAESGLSFPGLFYASGADYERLIDGEALPS